MSETPSDTSVPRPVTPQTPSPDTPPPLPTPPIDSARALELAALEATLPPLDTTADPPIP